LGGKYYTAEDVNIGAADVAQMNEVTKFVTGTPDVSGNPSPFTARGVFMGMKAGAGVKFGSDSLAGKTVAVQGLGSVGAALCEKLAADGANLKVYDINAAAVDNVVSKYGAQAVTAGEILTCDCDVFAPCAMGAVLNVNNIPNLKCKLVAGAANNVLMDPAAGELLDKSGILYLPDYIINAGGVVNCGMEIVQGGRYDKAEVEAGCDKIYDTTLKIIALAQDKKISTYQAADDYAFGIINAGR